MMLPLGSRVRLLIGLHVLIVAIGLVLRIVLLVHADESQAIGVGIGAIAYGLVADVLVGMILLAPIALFLALSGGGSLARPRVRMAALTGLAALALFGSVVEFFFFDEFTARFNHIAVDYLLFPGEVATNVWQSYNVPVFATAALALGALVAWPIHRWLRDATFAPEPIGRRLIGALVVLVVATLAVFAVRVLPSAATGNRRIDEISANGMVQLARAFATAHLDYHAYYRTVAEDQARAIVASELRWPSPDQPVRTFSAARRRGQPLDIVVVLEESLGSEFTGRLGGKNPVTPQFDRWCGNGLLLTNLVATGNRTVRGLEGVLCSFPPLPGDSVWKREKSQNVASIARVLRAQGYQTEFIYGGAGTFDGMKSFATANGWDRFVEDGVIDSDFPDDAYRTAWGVADEYSFAALLKHQREARANGTPFFATLMSTSNHKPFLTPDTVDPRRSSKKLVKWGSIGLVLLVVLALTWWFAGRRIGWVRLGILTALLLVGYGVWLDVKLQPKDSRDHAVGYSDRVLCEYLDQAKADGLLEHTAVLIVGDHGARVYGAGEIPAESYRIPALFLAPEASLAGTTIDRLCSQVDLAPTLLSLAGVDYRAPFFGQDLLSLPPDGPGRAWLIHNRDIGLLTDDQLVVLGLQRTTTCFRRTGRSSDDLVLVPASAHDARIEAVAERAAALFQIASALYEGRAYVLPEGH